MQDRLRLLERRDIDELVILDISATPNKRAPRFDLIREYTSGIFAPVTVGGGIRSVEDAAKIISGGADKIAVGTLACDAPGKIGEIAKKYGAQAVVVAIDVHRGMAVVRCGTVRTEKPVRDFAREVEGLGAGEILLNDIERDGTLSGYNLDLIHKVASAVSIPVIACGGCGTYQHMLDAMHAGAHAVAAGALWQFTDCTPKGAAKFLAQHGVPTRI